MQEHRVRIARENRGLAQNKLQMCTCYESTQVNTNR